MQLNKFLIFLVTVSLSAAVFAKQDRCEKRNERYQDRFVKKLSRYIQRINKAGGASISMAKDWGNAVFVESKASGRGCSKTSAYKEAKADYKRIRCFYKNVRKTQGSYKEEIQALGRVISNPNYYSWNGNRCQINRMLQQQIKCLKRNWRLASRANMDKNDFIICSGTSNKSNCFYYVERRGNRYKCLKNREYFKEFKRQRREERRKRRRS